MANVSELQDFLFKTLQEIKKGTIDVDQAKAINNVAQTMVNSAKAEVEFASVIGNVDSQFFRRSSPTALTAQEKPNAKETEVEDLPSINHEKLNQSNVKTITTTHQGNKIIKDGPITRHIMK